MLSDQFWGACVYRLVMDHQPSTEEFAHALLRNLLRGVTAQVTPA